MYKMFVFIISVFEEANLFAYYNSFYNYFEMEMLLIIATINGLFVYF